MKMLLIVGVGRSGTSLLQSMLHSHSQISFLPETQFLRKYILPGKESKIDSNTEKSELISKLHTDVSFARAEVDPAKIIDVGNSYLEVYRNFLREFPLNRETVYIGDKDPRLLDFLSHLDTIDRSTRIIHIMRDPRSVIASRMKANWSKRWPFFLHVFLYKAQFERGRRIGKSVFGDRYYELYYEDLLKNPAATLKGISVFLQLEFEKSMLAYQNSANELMDKAEEQWKRETTGPLLTGNADKWMNQLSGDQIYLIQSLLKSIFKSHPFTLLNVGKISIQSLIGVAILKPMASLFERIYPLRTKLLS